MNSKKLYRLYSEEGLAVRRRRGRKRATGTRAPMALPDGPNQRWSLDFVSDALDWGRRFRILAVVDDFTREGAGPGGRHLDRRPAPGARTRHPRRPPRQTRRHRQRQRHRDDQPGHPGMDQPHRRRLALHRPRQAAAERLRRELQRPPAGRVPQRGGLRQPRRGPHRHRALAARLQSRPPTFGAWRAKSRRDPLGPPRIKEGVSPTTQIRHRHREFAPRSSGSGAGIGAGASRSLRQSASLAARWPLARKPK